MSYFDKLRGYFSKPQHEVRQRQRQQQQQQSFYRTYGENSVFVECDCPKCQLELQRRLMTPKQHQLEYDYIGRSVMWPVDQLSHGYTKDVNPFKNFPCVKGI